MDDIRGHTNDIWMTYEYKRIRTSGINSFRPSFFPKITLDFNYLSNRNIELYSKVSLLEIGITHVSNLTDRLVMYFDNITIQIHLRYFMDCIDDPMVSFNL